MNSAHHINDEAGAPSTGAPIVSPGAYPAKRATVTAEVLARADAHGLREVAALERARVVPAGLAPLGDPGAAAAGDQPRARPHQRRDTVITGRVSNAPDGEGVSAPGFAMLAAQLALAGGHVLTDLSDGSFMVSRWGHTRHCSDLHAVAQFAKQLGVKP